MKTKIAVVGAAAVALSASLFAVAHRAPRDDSQLAATGNAAPPRGPTSDNTASPGPPGSSPAPVSSGGEGVAGDASTNDTAATGVTRSSPPGANTAAATGPTLTTVAGPPGPTSVVSAPAAPTSTVAPYIARSGDITTFAGTGMSAFSGDGGPATAAEMMGPSGVAADDLGNVFIADTRNGRIRKVDPNGVITTIAGIGLGSAQYGSGSGDGGPARIAQLSWPSDLAVDGNGNLYLLEDVLFADFDGSRIRKIDTRGIISTVAGGGLADVSDHPIEATQAKLRAHGIAVDRAGTIYTAERSIVRRVGTNGMIATVAGTYRPGGISGPVPGADNGDGGPALAAVLAAAMDVALDSVGNAYVADDTRVRRIGTSGTISTVAGTGVSGHAGDGGPATSATLESLQSIAMDRSGNLYVAQRWTCWCVRKVDGAGVITTVAGGGTQVPGDRGPATSAVLGQVAYLAVDPAGNLFIGDSFCTHPGHYECVPGLNKPVNRVRKVWA